MDAQKKKTGKKELTSTDKNRKPQEPLPKTAWTANPDEKEKSHWNPCALYF